MDLAWQRAEKPASQQFILADHAAFGIGAFKRLDSRPLVVGFQFAGVPAGRCEFSICCERGAKMRLPIGGVPVNVRKYRLDQRIRCRRVARVFSNYDAYGLKSNNDQRPGDSARFHRFCSHSMSRLAWGEGYQIAGAVGN